MVLHPDPFGILDCSIAFPFAKTVPSIAMITYDHITHETSHDPLAKFGIKRLAFTISTCIPSAGSQATTGKLAAHLIMFDHLRHLRRRKSV